MFFIISTSNLIKKKNNFESTHFNPSCDKAGIFQWNHVSTVPADCLVPRVVRSSAMVLTVQDKEICVFLGVWRQLPCVILESRDGRKCICFRVLGINSTCKGLMFSSSPPWQNGCHFADDIFRCIFMNENFWILIKDSLKFVPKGAIDNNPALV